MGVRKGKNKIDPGQLVLISQTCKPDNQNRVNLGYPVKPTT
jgi:hypothetical protein